MSCTIAPYLTEVNVTYSNASQQFTSEVVSVSDKKLQGPDYVANVNNWLFRTTNTMTGNHIINSIQALQNTPSYEPGIFARGNVTIDWIKSMELLLQGMTEYQATRLRMILEAEMKTTGAQPSSFVPIKGIVSSWRLGYNGSTAPIATLFPLQGFILLCAITVVVIGARTGVRHVSKFDPTNTTHLIIAAGIGGRNGGLGALSGENAIHADAKALNMKIEYKNLQGFQEVTRGGDAVQYTELSDLRQEDEVGQTSRPGLFGRKPFVRTITGQM
ncbi:hypothetical protein LTR37_017684 [Vermiconidia calcicola]|uniref:Uncharacterized protein n=1 Tax=Vermiconidia calcicola TaxID=1690605 RepID=A0ACC3MKZ0_9PEZI|nr:hypothetical protein LTR37_017684 [Vermiconidia calcicola]